MDGGLITQNHSGVVSSSLFVSPAGSPPPEVEIEIGEDQSHNQSEEKERNIAEKEKEAVDGVFDPPVGILKSNYVSGKEEEAEIPGHDKPVKHKVKNGRRKLVPIWRLVRKLISFLINFVCYLLSNIVSIC